MSAFETIRVLERYPKNDKESSIRIWDTMNFNAIATNQLVSIAESCTWQSWLRFVIWQIGHWRERKICYHGLFLILVLGVPSLFRTIITYWSESPLTFGQHDTPTFLYVHPSVLDWFADSMQCGFHFVTLKEAWPSDASLWRPLLLSSSPLVSRSCRLLT